MAATIEKRKQKEGKKNRKQMWHPNFFLSKGPLAQCPLTSHAMMDLYSICDTSWNGT